MAVTVQNTVTDPQGNPMAGVPVSVLLVNGSTSPGYTPSTSIIRYDTTVTNNAGLWSLALVPNSQITPANTYYKVVEDNGYVSTIVVPASGGPYNLSSLVVVPPTPSALGITGVQVASGGTVIASRPQINFISGSNSSVVVADNLANNRVDVTVSSTTANATLPLFNVETYGATGNGTTDDFLSIQAAWNALVASGANGYLYFPRNATYVCNVDARINASAGGQYAALPIPLIANNSTTPMRVLGVVGVDAPTVVGRQYAGGANVAPPQGGAVIKVTYTTPFAWSGTHGLPSLFGGPDINFGVSGTSNVHFVVKNIQVRQPDPPSICNFNLEGVQCATVDEYFADSSAFPDSAAKPVNVTGCPILWPAPGNAAVLTVGRIGCWGYFAGIPFGEHLNADYVYSVRNWIGLPVRRGADHHATMNMTVLEENRFIIAGYDPSTVNGAVAVPGTNTNQMVIKVNNFDFEDFASGVDTWTYTRTHGSHVYDPNNQLRGTIWYAGINSGATAPTGRTDNMIAVGGTSLHCFSLLSGNVTALSQTGFAPVAPSSTVPGAPTIGTAIAGNASATVAYTAPGSNGGATILSYTATSTPGGLTGTGTTSPITVAGLTNGTAYTFTVHATNANGSSAESAASNSVTPTGGGTVNIFTTQTPANTTAADGPYTLGTLFTTSSNGQINGIRWRAPTTVDAGVIGLLYRWDSELTGTELARATFGTLTPLAWNTVTFTTPVAISTGVRYVAAVTTGLHYVATSGFFTGASVTNANLTAPADDAITPIRNGRLNVGGTPTFPSTSGGGACYFVDVIFQ